MKNRKDLVEVLRREVLRTQAFVAAADAFEELSSLEGQAENAVAMRDKALAEVAEAKANLAAALDGVSKAGEEGKAIIQAAQAKAAQIEEQASHNAQDIIAKAKADGEKAAAALKEDAAKSLSVVTAERDGLTRKNGELRAESLDLTAKRDALAGEVGELEAKLARVKQAIADLKG